MTGAELIAEERERQIALEGWTPEHDLEHNDDDLALAAACYILCNVHKRCTAGHLPRDNSKWAKHIGQIWPWTEEWFKPTKDPIRNLTKAGSLIAAEIDRRLQKQ